MTLDHEDRNGVSRDGGAPFSVGSGRNVTAPPDVIRVRRDFLACARSGLKHVAPGVVVQGRDRADGGPARFGLTCSKKIGNAVMRNRAKRRLREVARSTVLAKGLPGWDYVLIGRHATTIARPFDKLTGDVEAAFDRLHGKAG